MKKKLLFVNNNLHSGGIQRSLLNLLHSIEGQYDITLLLMYNEGEYKDQLPQGIKVLCCPSALRVLGMSQSEVSKESKLLFLWRSFFAVLCRLFGNSAPLRILSSFQKRLEGFDAAISYMQSEAPKLLYGGANEVVLRRIDAKEKIAVIHSDFLHCGSNTPAIREIYHHFDKIAACSGGCRDRFVQANPDLAGRVYVVNNFNDFDEIIRLSKLDPVQYPDDRINVITVARLSEEKGVERALLAVQACVKQGVPVLYHIVGDGIKRLSLQELAAQLGIAGHVRFYGTQKNPYRYMKNADLFLLPSYHEAAPIVFTEAKCLGVPILSTETTSVLEMVLEDNAGWVCGNNSKDIRNSLIAVCSDREALRQKREQLAGRTFDNTLCFAQWRHLMGED